jgi:Uma2 family endonuclease
MTVISHSGAMVGPRYAVAPLAVRRFTVDEYHRMIRDGYFAADERFELVEGLIVEKMPRDPVHDAALEIALALLQRHMPEGWRVRPQCAITLSDSEPEPDLAVVRGVPTEYVSHHPGPSDLALVVEISNTTLADDRQLKARIYARAGITVYWIINLVDRRIEMYTDPSGDDSAPAFRQRQDFALGASVPLSINGTERGPIAVTDLLPPLA